MENVFKMAKNEEVTLKVVYDDCGESPRDWDNLGKMVCWHSRHSLGDKHDHADTDDLFKSLLRDVMDKKLMKRIILHVKQGKCENLKLAYNRSSKEWELMTKSASCVSYTPISEDMTREEKITNMVNYHVKNVQKALGPKWYTEYTFPAPIDFESDVLLDSIMEFVDAKDIVDFVKEYYTILPLYLYDHSGLTMNTSGFSCRWDSGQVGWIYCSHERCEKETGYTKEELFSTNKHRRPKVGERVKIASQADFGQVKSISGKKLVVDFDYNKALDFRKPENLVNVTFEDITEVLANRAEEMLEGEVETFDQYLTGDVYGFVLETNDGDHIESCWGFYGDDFKENGMTDHIPDEYQDLVSNLKTA